MNHKFAVLLGFVALLISPMSQSNDDDKALIEMLANAKVSGMCGVFGQMARFQSSTKLKNGDDFVARFAYSEAARFGKTLNEFSDTCESATNNYDSLMKQLRGNESAQR